MASKSEPVVSVQRNWSKYNKESLCKLPERIKWDISAESIWDFLNQFEVKVLEIVDHMVPLTTFTNNMYCKEGTPGFITQK
jgi:hypothetical protein